MAKTDRLFQIMHILRDGRLHRAQDLARQCAVSVRTLYRDMDTLVASGFPVAGTRGTGYRTTGALTLPPLTLTPDELEALQLGLAITAESTDADLRGAAQSLAAKVDAVLPQQATAEADLWKTADFPFADSARGIAQMPTLRAAIKCRQKLRLTYTDPAGAVTSRVVWPLKLENLGRIWMLTAWCELRGAFRVFRTDLIETADALPALFRDEPGKTLADFAP